jgi:hypothetical protein
MAKRKSVRRKRSPSKPKAKAAVKAAANNRVAKQQGLAEIDSSNSAPNPPEPQRWLPSKSELATLYQRYTNGAQFDEHDKAFYFVLDIGGISRARQLIAHVEEVLLELEEYRE